MAGMASGRHMNRDYHLMNKVKILQPRWNDRVILPRVDKFKGGGNIITIAHANYPSEYFMRQSTADQYPQETKHGRHGDYQVYVIPLDDLTTIGEREEILNQVEELL